MTLYKLPKQYSVDFSQPKIKPKSTVDLDSSPLLDPVNTYYLLFNEVSGTPKGLGANIGPLVETGSVTPINDQQGTYREINTGNFYAYGGLSDEALRPSASFTVFSKVKRTSALTDFSGIFTGPMRSNGKSWVLLGNVSNNVLLAIEDSAGFKLATSTTVLPLNEWVSVIGTYDGSNIRLYVNGKLEATMASGSPDYGTSTQLPAVGAYPIGDPSDAQWQGGISYAGITHRAWSDGQVRDFYNNEYQILKPKTPPVYFTPSSISGTNWNAIIKDALDNGDVVLSAGNTVATITLPAFATYDTDVTETITWTIPAASLTTSVSPIVATPTFTVTAVVSGVSIPVIMNQLRNQGIQ